MHATARLTVLTALLGIGATVHAQQLPDRGFRPPVPRPAYALNTGPRLCLDEAHFNFHTLDDRFWAFGELARRDGFRVSPLRQRFTAESMRACDILVISNAQPNNREWDTYTRPTPSAFTSAEIASVKAWVERGGRLLLIADHMPLAGAAAALAAAFGAQFSDGFAYESTAINTTDVVDSITAARSGAATPPTLFQSRDRTLADHAIARGRDSTERVTQVRSFTGQAFTWNVEGAAPLLVLSDRFFSLEPAIAWQFTRDTPVRRVSGWWQGGTRRVGGGRVALFGEAAMFSAQVAGANRSPMGMNAPLAEQNAQFTLNVLRWLAGVIEP